MNLKHFAEMMINAEERWLKLLGTDCIKIPIVNNLMNSGLSLSVD